MKVDFPYHQSKKHVCRNERLKNKNFLKAYSSH